MLGLLLTDLDGQWLMDMYYSNDQADQGSFYYFLPCLTTHVHCSSREACNASRHTSKTTSRLRSPESPHDLPYPSWCTVSRACVLSSHLAHELSLPNGTDRVHIYIQIGKMWGTPVGGAISKGAVILREGRAWP